VDKRIEHRSTEESPLPPALRPEDGHRNAAKTWPKPRFCGLVFELWGALASYIFVSYRLSQFFL